MKPPPDAELFETPISTHWFDENGILCGLSKKGGRTLENYREMMELYKRFTTNGNKLCLLADATHTGSMSKEVVEYITTEQPKYLKAIAIISPEPLGAPQVTTFMKLSFSNFPVMKFSCEIEATAWLKEHL